MLGDFYDIEKAFLNRFYDGGFRHDLDIAFDNLPYTPIIGTPYAEVFVIHNDITPYSLKHTNETDGIFRVILRYPVNESTKAIKEKAQEIFDWFKIGSRYTFNGQKVTVTRHMMDRGIQEAGWYKMVLTMYWKAFLSR